MLNGFNANQNDGINEFHQRVADQNIQSIEDRQEEISHAKNGFIGMLVGIVVGGVVGWLFWGQAETFNKEKVIPVIRRPLIPAKIQPNEPGGMEIDNQDREIYHIVDNTPKPAAEVNIIPAPDMPKLVIENAIPAPESMENLVESIEKDTSLDKDVAEFSLEEDNVKVAGTKLEAIKTNSREKVAIPEKINNIEVKLQNTVNSDSGNTKEEKEIKTAPKSPEKIAEPVKVPSAKGTWYAQIIASSSRSAVDTLWQKLSAKHQFLKKYPHEVEEITAANGNTLYRLKVGRFQTRKEAEALASQLKQNQISSIIKQN